MAGSYSQILLHIVFSTKRRQSWITRDVAERLYSYLGGRGLPLPLPHTSPSPLGRGSR